ncbi:MAG: redoxin domain-containing protein [Phaeodactylibacter sp.]|nr:redoxin domain-containing protein [Phaeodactylibacter sp.]MCB9052164.1 redoxin domain-containing protein [Lewinellaceae bacterium]
MVGVKNLNEELLSRMVLNTGETLFEFSLGQPVLLVFLRHFGCTFCREALADISKQRSEIEEQGSRIVFVHMTSDDIAERYFNRYGLDGAIHISDPECKFYAAFGLVKGNFTQLFGLSSWIRGFSAGVVAGHGVGPQLGDGFQMPGVFVIQEGEVKSSFIHKLASDRPDYLDLMRCCAMED